MYVASDEANNLALSQVLARGTPFADVAGVHLPEVVIGRNGHQASRYPPGMACLLLPAAALSLEAAFVLPLAAHLAGFFIMAWLLRKAGLSPLWATLYLLHPTAALHSRVLMSNLPMSTVLLASFGLLVAGRRPAVISAGLLLGMGVLLRQPAILAFAALSLWLIWRSRRSLLTTDIFGICRSQPALFLLGFLPGLALSLAYNWGVFGSPLSSGYAQVGALSLFSISALVKILPQYLLILLVCYPLLLFAPYLNRGPWRAPIIMITGLYLLFYGSFGWFDAGSTFAETLVRAPRFMLPALPFFLLAYANVLSRALRSFPGLERAVLAGVILIGLVTTACLWHRHHAAQAQQALARDALYASTGNGSMLVCSIEASELLQDAWGKRAVVDYAGAVHEELSKHLESGKPAYLINLKKPARSIFSAWGESIRSRLVKDARFRVSGGYRQVGQWRLGVWTVTAVR
jgi:hypothetical protein